MFRVLRFGLAGEDVRRWQHYLIGQGLLHEVANGMFDEATKQATIDFQRTHGLKVDGWVGSETIGHAGREGFPLVDGEESTSFEDGPGWPPPPKFAPLLCMADRQQIFGTFHYVPDPTPTNPEGIKLIDDWYVRNIIMVEIPQLAGVKGAPSSCRVPFHRLAAEQLKGMFAAWESAGLIPLVRTFAGTYCARFVRGSRQTLSNHSFGSAIDLNAQWNPLGAQPALKGKPGSMRELVPIANEHGFYSGIHFRGRPDGMHLEVAFIK